MPKLSALTDYDPMGSYSGLPVDDSAFDPNQKKVYITGEPEVAKEPSALSSNIDKVINALFRPDEKRLQLWPEKVVREALTAAPSVMSGETPQWAIDPETGDVHTNPQMVEKAQSMAALAGTGGLAGTTEGTLGATPFLRPALKYKDKLYKGKEGQQHMDVIPEALYPEFQKMAMSGEDISHYNFGFVNDKGHFLDREKALRYAIDTGLVDKYAGQFGALTSTLMADSSKPGAAIESLAKSQIPEYLYHATYEPYYNTIKSEGLRGGKNKNYEDSSPNKVYLSRDPENARSYAETSDIVPEDYLDKIKVLKIATKDLDKSKLKLDKNIIDNAGDTLEYHGVIKPNSFEEKTYKFTPVDYEPEFK